MSIALTAFPSRGRGRPGRGRGLVTAACCLLPVLGALPAAARAQTPPSILEFIPVEGSLRMPDRGSAALATGRFTGEEPVTPEGIPVRAWSFDGRSGDRVSVTLRSQDFDAVVVVVGPGLGQGLSDDDGGGGTDSRICVTLSENGTFRAVASALEIARGTFEVALARVDEASEALCPETEEERLWGGPVLGALRPGETVSGQLPEDAQDPSDLWQLEAPAGEPLTVMLTSGDFDAYLDVGGPGAPGELHSDDDSGGGCDARLEITPAGGNSYLVRVSTATGGGGAYQLSASGDPPPPSSEPCGGAGGVMGQGSLDEAARLVDASSGIEAERVVRVGQELGGVLSTSDLGFQDGTPAHVWKVEGVPAGALRVEVLSDDFDPYLYLFAGPERVASEDDDGAGGLASGITVALERADEEVWIVVRPVGADGAGSYRVRALVTGG